MTDQTSSMIANKRSLISPIFKNSGNSEVTLTFALRIDRSMAPALRIDRSMAPALRIDRSMAPAQKFLRAVKVFYADIASHGRLDENKR